MTEPRTEPKDATRDRLWRDELEYVKRMRALHGDWWAQAVAQEVKTQVELGLEALLPFQFVFFFSFVQ